MHAIKSALDLPPIWLVASMALMWWLAQAVPIVTWSPGISASIGWLIIIASVILTLIAAWQFRRAGTPVIPRRDPNALVTGGPFRFSRNPIYLADVLVLVGWFLVLGALTPFLVIPVFAWVIEARFIRGEEAALRSTFGDEFDAYCTRVRRWL